MRSIDQWNEVRRNKINWEKNAIIDVKIWRRMQGNGKGWEGMRGNEKKWKKKWKWVIFIFDEWKEMGGSGKKWKEVRTYSLPTIRIVP